MGSAARVLAGPIADRVGGARVTLVAVLGTGLSIAFTSFLMFATGLMGALFWLGVIVSVVGAGLSWHFHARPSEQMPS